MVNWCCLGFLFELVKTMTFLREVWQQAQIRRQCGWYCHPCLSKNLYFEVDETCLCGHLCVASLLLGICSHNPWVLYSGVRVCCWMSPSASRAPGVFGGVALPSMIGLSCRCVIDVMWLHKVNSNSNHCLFSELPFASLWVRHTRAATAAHPLEFEVSRCRTSKFAMCFLPAQTSVWNDLPYTWFDTGTLDGFREQSIVGCFLEFVFQFFRGAGTFGVA